MRKHLEVKMLKLKKSLALALAMALCLSLLAACGASGGSSQAPAAESTAPASQSTAAPAADSAAPIATEGKIAFITGTGGLGDKNMNDFTYAGVQRHEEAGVTVDVVQPKDIADIANLQRLYAETGEYATIVCVGSDAKEALTETAAEFPDQSFVICDTEVDLPNVTSVVFRAEETGFQLGVMASLLAREGSLANSQGKNTIGFVGGKDIAVINRFLAGYTVGAKLVNPDVTVLSSYVGSFGDPTAATELATGMYEQGADVIFACAGGSGLGVFTAAENTGGYAFGIETNQNVLAPDYVIASGTRDWGQALYEVTGEALAGTLKGGLVGYGIADGALMPEREGSNVEIPDDVMTTMEAYSAKVADGTYVLPITLDEVDAFLASNSGL